MSYQHKDLAGGRWKEFSFLEQMANIGSEVERALNWRAKNHAEYAQRAFERALELMDLTLESITVPTHFKEVDRVREALVDYFFGTNEFISTEDWWRKYFSQFAFAVRKGC